MKDKLLSFEDNEYEKIKAFARNYGIYHDSDAIRFLINLGLNNITIPLKQNECDVVNPNSVIDEIKEEVAEKNEDPAKDDEPSPFEEVEEKAPVKRFEPPTIDEVEEAMKLKGLKNAHLEAESFVNFYDCKNWYVGKNKMTSWRGAVVTWLNGIRRRPDADRYFEQPPEKMFTMGDFI